MKTLKISALIAFTCISLTSFSQEHKEAPKATEKTKHATESKPTQSNGNAEAMRRNLNYPNATNPADKNNQKYDKGTGRIENEHPKENQSNSYTRKNIEGKK